jgi:hypothetical protein
LTYKIRAPILFQDDRGGVPFLKECLLNFPVAAGLVRQLWIAHLVDDLDRVPQPALNFTFMKRFTTGELTAKRDFRL